MAKELTLGPLVCAILDQVSGLDLSISEIFGTPCEWGWGLVRVCREYAFAHRGQLAAIGLPLLLSMLAFETGSLTCQLAGL